MYVEVPDIGSTVEVESSIAAIESTKTAADVYGYVAGEVTEVNMTLNKDPLLINTSAEENGWIWKQTVDSESDLDGLLDENEYKKFVEENS